MNIHEYQAKSLLKKFNVAVPDGGIAYTPEEAFNVATSLDGPIWVVKSQIHAGGRGAGHFKNEDPKRGGVCIVESAEDVKKTASRMLGQTLITKQTGPTGKEVKQVYIEKGCSITQELYFSLLIDRNTSRITVIASSEGGMDIEDVAENSPEKIIKRAIDPIFGFGNFYARQIAFELGLKGKQVSSAMNFLTGIYNIFTELDANLIEINPMVVTSEDNVVALDAKMSFDDNALYRQPDITGMRDEDEEDPIELEASKHELNYIKLNGNIGCMVNGAGLAMATMDIIKLFGGEPANFLDVGGSADKERVTTAFKIILSDPDVEGILINIFGGIMRCDLIAQGVLAAAREVSLRVPLVVRLEGTNADMGKKILRESKLSIVAAENLSVAAKKIVSLVDTAR